MEKNKRFIIGIDPGISGAFALTDGEIVEILDMPVKMRGKTKHVDGVALSQWFAKHSDYCTKAIIEDVSSMRGDGVASAFKFGMRTGVVHGLLAAYDFSVIQVKPAVWKAAMGLSRNKKESLMMAKKIFPDCDYFERMKDDGRAEAALMAFFALENL